jgi:hypothetical protein
VKKDNTFVSNFNLTKGNKSTLQVHLIFSGSTFPNCSHCEYLIENIKVALASGINLHVGCFIMMNPTILEKQSTCRVDLSLSSNLTASAQAAQWKAGKCCLTSDSLGRAAHTFLLPSLPSFFVRVYANELEYMWSFFQPTAEKVQ